MATQKRLYTVYNQLQNVKGECSYKLIHELNLSELTIKQIEYITKIGEYEYITTSQFAEVTNLSKPSVTEMIKKFIQLDCVYKKQCEKDGRVYYIHLTEKGKHIAQFDQILTKEVVSRMMGSLEKEDVEHLISILSKVK